MAETVIRVADVSKPFLLANDTSLKEQLVTPPAARCPAAESWAVPYRRRHRAAGRTSG